MNKQNFEAYKVLSHPISLFVMLDLRLNLVLAGTYIVLEFGWRKVLNRFSETKIVPTG